VTRPLRVEWVGTYERDYPRTRVLVEGLRAHGVEVAEHHRPVWERTRHKAGGFLSPRGLAGAGLAHAGAWGGLLLDEVRHRGHVDAVVAGYPAQPDAVPAWLVARARRAPLVVDMMISLSDTLAGDRARVGGATGRLLAGVDRTALALADIVLADTREGADFLARRFGVRRDRLVVAPVGAEPGAFPFVPPDDGPCRVLWYGKLAPLHGLEVIVQAARAPGAPPIRLVGEGQLGDWLAAEILRDPPASLEHVPWIPYERLGAEVAASAVVLGAFGTSAKASRVVPNKVFQAMAAGRPVVTADTPGIREVLTDGEDCVLVPAGDPHALAGALIDLAADPERRARLGAAARRRYEEVGLPIAAAAPLVAALRERSR
jgi:glycosyltransferase involved in cell wall biosynthesis